MIARPVACECIEDATAYTNQQPTRKVINPAALLSAFAGLIKNLK